MDKNKFIEGIKDGLPIGLGYLSVAFAFGIFAVSSGLDVLQSLLVSMANVTSAGQLAAVPIMAAGGTVIEIIATEFIINLRYALMSVSLSQKFDDSMTLKHRLVIAFVNTDEVFAVASSKNGLVNKTYMYGLIIPPFVGWSLGTFVGAVAGDVLPEIITSALGIAIYGMFVAIVIPVAKSNRAVALCVAFSVALSAAFNYSPYLHWIPSGFIIIICAIIASAVLAAIAPITEVENNELS